MGSDLSPSMVTLAISPQSGGSAAAEGASESTKALQVLVAVDTREIGGFGSAFTKRSS